MELWQYGLTNTICPSQTCHCTILDSYTCVLVKLRHIKVSLVPDNMSLPLPSDAKVDFRLQLFRVRYVQFETTATSLHPRKEKTELYLQNNSALSSGDIILILVIAFTAITLILYFLDARKYWSNHGLDEPHGHYMLIGNINGDSVS